jgi:hypothetical protein
MKIKYIKFNQNFYYYYFLLNKYLFIGTCSVLMYNILYLPNININTKLN